MIWILGDFFFRQLSDLNRDGELSLEEFCIAMHLVVLRRHEIEIPDRLPFSLMPYTSFTNGEYICQRTVFDQKEWFDLNNFTKYCRIFVIYWMLHFLQNQMHSILKNLWKSVHTSVFFTKFDREWTHHWPNGKYWS